jgi:hypothetical protein
MIAVKLPIVLDSVNEDVTASVSQSKGRAMILHGLDEEMPVPLFSLDVLLRPFLVSQNIRFKQRSEGETDNSGDPTTKF